MSIKDYDGTIEWEEFKKRQRKTSEYWQQRFEQLEQSQYANTTEYFHDIELLYQQAAQDIEKDIAKWYMRYATENNVTYVDAMKALNSNELEEFRMMVQDYIKKGKSLDPQWMKQLESASVKYHVSRLEALQVQMQQSVETLMSGQVDHIEKLMKDVYTESYYQSAYEVMKGVGLGFEFMKLDTNKVNKIISKPWAPDGTNFSERIWGNHRPALVDKLQKDLSRSIMRGEAPDKLIKNIAKDFDVAKNKAANLVYTESAFFHASAQEDTFKELGVKEYEIVATLDRRTSDTCRYMDGKHFPTSERKVGYTAPPFHQRCRTVTAPWFDDDEFDEFAMRAARDDDGKYYTVPSTMTYDKWQQHYVDSPKVDKVKLSDKQQYAINAYVSSDSYKINDALRNGYDMDDHLKGITNDLDDALKQVPYYKGEQQSRSIEFYDHDTLQSFMKDYVPGQTIKFKEFLSTTVGDTYNPEAQVEIFIFDGKKGRDIRQWNKDEQEILYERDSEFKVSAVENINGKYFIQLDEV